MYNFEPESETWGITQRDRAIILMCTKVPLNDVPKMLSLFGYHSEPDGTIWSPNSLTPAVGRKSSTPDEPPV